MLQDQEIEKIPPFLKYSIVNFNCNTMQIPIYQVDAFSSQVFGGNPAAVCPLESWLPNDLMQKIALENNLAETAFFVQETDTRFHIRWFTPTVEVDLCGHATLATAHVLFTELGYEHEVIEFFSRSGILTVQKQDDLLELNFPADEIKEVEPLPALNECLGVNILHTYRGKSDYMVVLENETLVLELRPDLRQMATIEARGIIATAKGSKVDFVSRFFGPQSGIDEDPVTGSAHTTLTPYWAEQLGKTELTAWQISPRKGELWCKLEGDRVKIAGKAVLYLKGQIFV